jgi:hypothetical protein
MSSSARRWACSTALSIACKKLRKKSPAFDHVMLSAAEDIDAGTPYVTALLAGLVIAANIMLLVGILRTLDAFVGIGAHIQAGTAQVDGMLVVFQANIQVASETFLNYSATANDTLTAIRVNNQEAATLMFDDIIPNAAPAPARTRCCRSTGSAPSARSSPSPSAPAPCPPSSSPSRRPSSLSPTWPRTPTSSRTSWTRSPPRSTS